MTERRSRSFTFDINDFPYGSQVTSVHAGPVDVEWIPQSQAYECQVFGTPTDPPIATLNWNNRKLTGWTEDTEEQNFGIRVQTLDGSTIFGPIIPAIADNGNVRTIIYDFNIAASLQRVVITSTKMAIIIPTPKKLTALQITFDTGSAGGDNKNGNTSLWVDLYRADGSKMAEYSQTNFITPPGVPDASHEITGEFPEGTRTVKPLALLNTTITSDSDLDFRIHIKIQPNPEDSWSFSWAVTPFWDGVPGLAFDGPYWTLANPGPITPQEAWLNFSLPKP